MQKKFVREMDDVPYGFKKYAGENNSFKNCFLKNYVCYTVGLNVDLGP